jgi:hypothetical protein
VPFLFDLTPYDLGKNPISSFQSLTNFNKKEDIYKLIESINKTLKDNKISEKRLEKYFDIEYNDFEKTLSEIKAKKSCENKQIKNKEESKIDLKIRSLLSLADKYYYKENYTVAKELYDEVIKLREETKKSRIESTV